MYLYKVYLHCQECLGTERRQLLAARSPARGQDLKWLPSGLLKCRRPGPPHQGQRAAGGRADPRRPRSKPRRTFPQKDGLLSQLFFFKLLEKLQSNIAMFQVIKWWQGSFLNPTHLHMLVTPMPTTFATHERNSCNFLGKKVKSELPTTGKYTTGKLEQRPHFPIFNARFWPDLESVAKHVYMQNENQKTI